MGLNLVSKHGVFIFTVFLSIGVLADEPTQANAVAQQANVFFESRIRPLLVRRCLRCHGGEKTSQGLRVDSREAMMRGGESGAAIVPGRPDASLLIQAVRYGDDGLQMPPNGKLPKQEIALLEQWVEMGTPWPTSKQSKGRLNAETHWAFQAIPQAGQLAKQLKKLRVANSAAWSNNPIDVFVSARQHEQGIEHVEAADRRTLIRRVYFDLLGLPPSWQKVATFIDDQSPDAYERLIECLLASPQYGERWGRHWLDLARYADTQGGSVDCPIPAARLYRDYVIDSFRVDKPYDVFIREQLAGDLLAAQKPSDQSAERVIATGFVGLSIRNGIFKHYHPELIIEDTIDTIGRSILGMAVRCARCHDHKFEPISTADYYRMYGIFASSRYPFSGSELPRFSAGETVPLISLSQWKALPNEQREKIEQLRAKIAEQRADHPAQQTLKKKRKRLAGDVRRYHEIRRQGKFDGALRTSIDDQDIRIREDVSKLDEGVRKQWDELKALERAAGIERAYAMREATPEDVHVQVAGDPFDPGPLVKRGTPERLWNAMPVIPEGQSGRLQLAQWLTDNDHPLTPRVAVNYIWQFHFGKGLVSTPDNFGLGGAAPTHPLLLDWLAREFLDSGWSIKHLHRLIMTSQTYRLASTMSKSAMVTDPTNRSYWRFDRRRVDAESLRDGVMQVAGTLDLRCPGAHPFPAESSWQFSQHAPFKVVYESSHRSVYLMTQRIQRHPFLALFDGPDTSRATTGRKGTSKALQALYLRNSPFVHKQAKAFARRLLEQNDDSRQRVETAIRQAWSREPDSAEVDAALAYIAQYAKQWKRDAEAKSSVAPQLVLEYKFDGDAKDTSGLQRHGTLVGDPKFIESPRGQCISLDGEGDYVDSLTTMNDLGKSFAIECWVRPGPEQADYGDIFGNHLGGGRGFVLQQNGNATNQFRGSLGVGGDVWVLSKPMQLQTGKWQRIAMVRTPTAMRLFLNGKQQASVATTAEVQPSPLSFRVGLGISIVERSFFGEIDELRVYRGAPEEYREPVEPEKANIAAWASYCRLLLTSNEFLYVD